MPEYPITDLAGTPAEWYIAQQLNLNAALLAKEPSFPPVFSAGTLTYTFETALSEGEQTTLETITNASLDKIKMPMDCCLKRIDVGVYEIPEDGVVYKSPDQAQGQGGLVKRLFFTAPSNEEVLVSEATKLFGGQMVVDCGTKERSGGLRVYDSASYFAEINRVQASGDIQAEMVGWTILHGYFDYS
jgi:hypothetical protein